MPSREGHYRRSLWVDWLFVARCWCPRLEIRDSRFETRDSRLGIRDSRFGQDEPDVLLHVIPSAARKLGGCAPVHRPDSSPSPRLGMTCSSNDRQRNESRIPNDESRITNHESRISNLEP